MAKPFNWQVLRNIRRKSLFLSCAVAALSAASFAAPQQEHNAAAGMSLPSVIALPTTSESTPYLSVQNAQQVIDLAKYGYVEEEYLLSGTANIYKWDPDYTVRVDKGNVPYATRIIVRRPMDPSRSNGTGMVEVLHPGGAVVWSLVHEYMISKGITWVGVTMVEQVAVVKKYSSERYTSLTIPPSVTCPGPPTAAAPAVPAGVTQNGQDWDIISQVGMLLKTRPPNGVRVDHVYATGLSFSSGIVMNYVNFFHPVTKLPNGKPVYDGYFLAESGRTHLPISACQPPPDEAHVTIPARGVPIVRLLTQTETPEVLAQRRSDGDTPDDKFRLYEVAGPSHITDYSTHYGSGSKEALAIGSRGAGYAGCAQSAAFRLNDFPFQYFANAALESLDRWSRQGTPPPPGVRIAVTTDKTMSPPVSTVNLDEHFNPVGGVRSPYVDVPTKTYTSNSLGPGCANMGYVIPFTTAQLRALYPAHSDYVSKVNSEVDEMVKGRWITEEDGQKIKDEAEHANVP